MSRKKSDEVRVTEYFDAGEQAKVEVVFEIVKGIMKRRKESLEAKQQSKPKPRKKRATKAEMAARAAVKEAVVSEEKVPF